MIEKVEILNSQQMSSKKPVIEKSTVCYEWQDGDLMRALVKGIDQFWPYQTDKQNEESEKAAVAAANRIAGMVEWGCSVTEIEKIIQNEKQSMDVYGARRLSDMGIRIVKTAKFRNSLLIYGEGGIGKTYFIYKLVKQLEKVERPYVIAFNQAGISKINEIGINAIVNSCKAGFTLLIDACNELDEEGFSKALNIMSETLKIKGANVVVTTKTGSPTSRIAELKDVVAVAHEFGGVEPYAVYDLLSECSDSLIVQYQDMLFSNNPRNLNIMARKIAELKPEEDGRNAVAQRTTLIEDCIKQKPLKKKRWEQTKKICGLLYGSDRVTFSRDDVGEVLGKDADPYITDMISNGFIECSNWEGLKYSFSSESQIRYVVARCLNSDLDLLDLNWENPKDDAMKVARLVSQKSGWMYGREMAQVAVDRYCNHGSQVVMELISAMIDQNIDFEWENILRQTIFPVDEDFATVVSHSKLDPCLAFVEFGGIMNTPFNLVNYANKKFIANQNLLANFFMENWQNWQLAGLIRRVRSIAEYVSITQKVPERGAVEWVWLAVWCSHSSNVRLRAVSQRLLFVVCDASDRAIGETLKVWNLDADVYARRAISKVLAHLCMDSKQRQDVKAMIAAAMQDPNITDAIVISNLCLLQGYEVGPINFASRNVYSELGCNVLEYDDIKYFEELVWDVDLFMEGFFPFDIHNVSQGEISLSYCDCFIDAPVDAVSKWNNELKGKLKCENRGECRGLRLLTEDFKEYYPATFSTQALDSHKLLNCAVLLTKKWIERFGGDLEHMLGEYRSYDQENCFANSPNRKPIDCAIGEFMGSLSANYYQKEIIVDGNGFNKCGFCQYKEEAYNEPGETCVINPVHSHVIDSARLKLSERIESPQGKPSEWFHDIGEAYSEILSLLEPIKMSSMLWHPIALVARAKIRVGTKLDCSNEILISCAFNSCEHIDGGKDDRYLTIEHRNYPGNMRDYSLQDCAQCLTLPGLATDAAVSKKNPILLPPPSMVKAIGLKYASSKGVFVDKITGETVILCDGNFGNLYEEPVYNVILIRDDAFSRLVKIGKLTFFAFTERYNEKKGYANECCRHWEFDCGGFHLKHFANGNNDYENLDVNTHCKDCYFSYAERRKRKPQMMLPASLPFKQR